MQKYAFFDIDGTLIGERERQGFFPPSAKEALKRAKKKGTKLFINTGRVAAMVDPYFWDMDFDGFLCGCGTYISYEGEILYYKGQTPEVSWEIARLVRACRLSVFYERRDAFFYDSQACSTAEEERLLRFSKEKGLPLQDLPDAPDWHFDKFLIWYDEASDLARFRAGLQGKFEYIERNGRCAEIVPLGCSKATAMQMLLEKIGGSLDESYAFGDSLNDRSMLEAAGTGIALGDPSPLHAYADYVTAPLLEDGLAKAMAHFDLI